MSLNRKVPHLLFKNRFSPAHLSNPGHCMAVILLSLTSFPICAGKVHRGQPEESSTVSGRGSQAADHAISRTASSHQANRTSEPVNGIVRADIVNLRKRPDATSEKLTTLRRGAKLKTIEESGGWCRVQLPDASSGWIMAKYVALTKPLPSLSLGAKSKDPKAAARGAMDKASLPKQRTDSGTKLDSDPAENRPNEESAGTPGGSAAVLDGHTLGWIASPKVRVRSEAGQSQPVIGKLSRGTRVEVVESKDSWYKIRFADSQFGWIAGWLVRLVKHEKTPGASDPETKPVRMAQAGPLGESVVNSASRYQGLPYRRGGSLPSRGFDCSGLVYRVLRTHGVVVPRTSDAMFKVGRPVPREELKAGDLVFFQNTYRKGISHVGISMGGGKFIHSSQPGSGVIVSRLDDPYFMKHWAGARRIP